MQPNVYLPTTALSLRDPETSPIFHPLSPNQFYPLRVVHPKLLISLLKLPPHHLGMGFRPRRDGALEGQRRRVEAVGISKAV